MIWNCEMDPKRTREALLWWHRANDRISPKITDEGVGHVAEIVVTAGWALDLFEECETCGGERVVEYPYHDQPLTTCPSCKGRGFSLNQDFVEFLYNAEARIWNAAKNDTDLDEPLFDRVLAFLLERE